MGVRGGGGGGGKREEKERGEWVEMQAAVPSVSESLKKKKGVGSKQQSFGFESMSALPRKRREGLEIFPPVSFFFLSSGGRGNGGVFSTRPGHVHDITAVRKSPA